MELKQLQALNKAIEGRINAEVAADRHARGLDISASTGVDFEQLLKATRRKLAVEIRQLRLALVTDKANPSAAARFSTRVDKLVAASIVAERAKETLMSGGAGKAAEREYSEAYAAVIEARTSISKMADSWALAAHRQARP